MGNERTVELGRIERVDPRTYWGHEAHDFTPWLRANISLLGEALGIEIDPAVEREVAVGPFSADLLGTDLGSGATILVENQLEPTDHSHLGQLLTYASGLDARVVVWVSRQFRDEHRQALMWLNENTPEDLSFFGIQIELIKIGDSALAPDLKVVVMPSEWQKIAAAARTGQATDRQQRYKAFWAALIEDILDRNPRFTSSRPERAPRQSWCSFSIGRAGFSTNAAFSWSNAGLGWQVKAELYIDTGDFETNKKAFDLLVAQRSRIESDFGEILEWTRRDDIRASRVFISTPGSIDDDQDRLESYRAWLVERVFRLREVFGDRVTALDLS